MDISRVDLNLLLVFQAIGREQSVTKAASRLGLSQPAVSSALARLRVLLNDPLFIRTSRGMQPTLRARQLAEPIDSALGLIRTSLQQHSGFDPARSDAVLNLLITDIGEIIYLPPLIEHLRRAAPGIGLRVRHLSQSRYADALESGAADLAVGFVTNMRASFRYRRLLTDRFTCMVREDHPTIGAALTTEQYLAASHLIKSQKGLNDGLVAKTLASMGLKRRVTLTVPHVHAIPDIIARSDLIVTLPSDLAKVYVVPGKTRIVPLPVEVPAFDVGLHWHERCHNDPANRWLRGLMVELFGEPAARVQMGAAAQ
ncbi:MAG: LysR family transcriptional regulator [Candidatus Eiseniibacteriota bacterium]